MLKCKRSLCTVQNYYTTCIPKYEHCPGELSQDIMASSSWKEKTPCIKVGCLRPAVTFFFFFIIPNTDPCSIWQCFRSPLLQKETEGTGALTSVLLLLVLQRWRLCQTEDWAEPWPGATTVAPGSFGFDDTETRSKKKNRMSLTVIWV